MRSGMRGLSLCLALVVFLTFLPFPVSAQGDRLQVAVSTPLLADIVRNVAGDRADVFSIMPENADPHTWEATPQDMVRMTGADTFISVGAHLEPFVESGGWRRAVMDSDVAQLTLAEHVDLIVVDMVIDHGDHTHDLREGDPHFWLDPTKVIEALPAIAAHLAELDPAGAETYAHHADTYTVTLDELDAELEQSFIQLPRDRRVLIVFHDAYRYFAARYGFEVVGVVVRNPESDISAQEVVELQEAIEEHSVPVIFAEPQFNTDILDVIVEGDDVQIGVLLTDAFAGEVDSYVEMMRFNRDSLMQYLAP
ncbi:MAG TPA: metal ABC transporter substrate-binding protein [Thermomicrobiales bacterium]|nr:metal ABC transporter substrate-binding protein [Thermomicrobiales bacterium]